MKAYNDILDKEIKSILLKDKTTKKFIRWATDNYISYGDMYLPCKQMFPELFKHKDIIQPRATKSIEEKLKRTRSKAEVFSPAWVCNRQINLIDNAWFGKENVFNVETEKGWETNKQLIKFAEGKTWKKYVDERRIEICCGEAPYLVSRYDTVLGQAIDIERRIGMLDRKLRVINENVNDYEEWFNWVIRAYQSIYGYEYQGDNVMLARENLLYTFIDNMEYKFKRKPTISQLKKICNVIVWNIWQMDGLTFTSPYSKSESQFTQLSFFSDAEYDSCIYSRIFDWRANESLEYRLLL